MTDIERLENEFHADMLGILEKEPELRALGWKQTSSRFRQMVEQYRGVEAAYRLLDPSRELPPDTFTYTAEVSNC